MKKCLKHLNSYLQYCANQISTDILSFNYIYKAINLHKNPQSVNFILQKELGAKKNPNLARKLFQRRLLVVEVQRRLFLAKFYFYRKTLFPCSGARIRKGLILANRQITATDQESSLFRNTDDFLT